MNGNSERDRNFGEVIEVGSDKRKFFSPKLRFKALNDEGSSNLRTSLPSRNFYKG